jgi:hypothetical protein
MPTDGSVVKLSRSCANEKENPQTQSRIGVRGSHLASTRLQSTQQNVGVHHGKKLEGRDVRSVPKIQGNKNE